MIRSPIVAFGPNKAERGNRELQDPRNVPDPAELFETSFDDALCASANQQSITAPPGLIVLGGRDKYVNMADIKSAPARVGLSSTARAEPDKMTDPTALDPATITEAIELLFFAYRDFVSDPDALLAEDGFGRAHHRVLHFVQRHPGITVAELLEILRITKQSLSRVLRDLIDKGLVEQQPGPKDRRQRLLFLTTKGEDLYAAVSSPQRKRVEAAIASLGPEGLEAWRRMMLSLVNAEDRPEVHRLLGRSPFGSNREDI